MQVTSAAFQSALTRSHNMAVKLDVYRHGETSPAFSTTQVSGSPLPHAYLTGGSVTMEKSADIRSRCSFTLVDPTFAITPLLSTDLFTPFGNEVVVSRGIAYSDGTPPEFVRLGTYRISEVSLEDKDGGTSVSVTGYDRSRTIGRYTTTVPYFQAGSVSYAHAIRVMIQSRYPSVQFDEDETRWESLSNDTSISTRAAIIPEGTNLWTESRKMAAAIGCDIYFDAYGICTMIRDPVFAYTSSSINVPPVASYIEGSTATFLSSKRVLSDTNSYNYMVANGEGNGSSLRSAPALDDDPNSPTYVYGPYGIVNKTITSPLLVSQRQADDYAQLQLRRSIGGQENAEITAIVNPALEIDDVVAVTRTRIGLTNASYAIDSLTIPLLAGDSMPVKFRERRALIRGY